jgi:hypothetical protein
LARSWNAAPASYADYVRQHDFRPAGITATDIRVYKPSQIPGMARGYVLVGRDGEPVPPGP